MIAYASTFEGEPNPAVLLINSKQLASDSMTQVQVQLKTLVSVRIAGKARESYGQVIVCDAYDEMEEVADSIASEYA